MSTQHKPIVRVANASRGVLGPPMPVVMRLLREWKRFWRGLVVLNVEAADQRERIAAASHAYRAVGAAIVLLLSVVLTWTTGWNGGYVSIAVTFILILQAEGHRRGLLDWQPLATLILEVLLFTAAFGALGLSGAVLGGPLAYVAVTATLLLPPRQGITAGLIAFVAFGFIPGMRFRVDPGLGPEVMTWVEVAVNSLFAIFVVIIVWSMFVRLIGESARYRRSNTYQQALSECSQALLDHRDPTALTKACEALLPATRADYVYVEEVYTGPDGREFTKVVAHANAIPDWESSTDMFMGGPVDVMPTSTAPLMDGQAVVIRTRDLVGEERRLYEADGLKSEILVPIIHERRWVGSVGFVEYQDERDWDPSEIEAVETAADMISSYHSRALAYRQLVESLTAKDRFVASVSHELRTPLSVVLGFAKELEDHLGSFESEEIAFLSGYIAKHATEVSAIVDDLLVSARTEAGTLTVRPEWVDVDRLVADVLGENLSLTSGDSIEVSGTAPSAWADPLRVRQILRNLLTNADRYGGPRAWVELSERDDSAVVRVCDSGVGLEPDDQHRIFEPYMSIHDRTGTPASVGLGLSVARQLARLMDGDVRVVPGDHTIFELILPREPSSCSDDSPPHPGADLPFPV